IVDTGQDSDTGDRIRLCAPYVGDMFHATYGDGLGDVNLHKLLEFHKSHGGVGTITSVPLRSQYGTIVSNGDCRVQEFHEKPVVRDHWINAGFFVFSKGVFDRWNGHNLECEVLPNLVPHGLLYTYRHEGFWKSMDTSKDQNDLEKLYLSGQARWIADGAARRSMAVPPVNGGVVRGR
ncbi:MAG: hypothetical protein HY763_14670, partial [Planctomycetes bacterium]|nr:hypothetical protein [Planctomycetota bacterium]